MDNSLVAEILRGQGAIMERLDALEKLICAEEDHEESSGPEPVIATNPAVDSTMLETFDIPPVF